MADALEQHELRSWESAPRSATRSRAGGTRPADPTGSAWAPERRELALVGLELVESRRSGRARACRAGLPELRTPSSTRRAPLVELGGGLLEQRGERVPGEAVQERLALDRGSHRLGDLDPLVVGKESRVGDHQAGDGIRVIARPAQPDQAAGVVDQPARPGRARPGRRKLSTASTWRSKVPGGSGGESPKPGTIRRHRSVAR